MCNSLWEIYYLHITGIHFLLHPALNIETMIQPAPFIFKSALSPYNKFLTKTKQSIQHPFPGKCQIASPLKFKWNWFFPWCFGKYVSGKFLAHWINRIVIDTILVYFWHKFNVPGKIFCLVTYSVLLVAHSAPVKENNVVLSAFNANFWQTALEHRFVCNKLATSLQHTFHFGKGRVKFGPLFDRKFKLCTV